MHDVIKDFIYFLSRSPTVWHAARECTERLSAAHFTPLYEKERWHLEPGKGYFVVRDHAAVCAFRLPKGPIERATLLASHLDSPSLKLKPLPHNPHHRMMRLITEVYGSPLLHTWMDRDLCLAGRVLVRTQGTLEQKLIVLDHAPLIIPSLPTHLDRASAEKGFLINKQDHLQPIATLLHSQQHPYTLRSLIATALSFDELLSWDLFLVPLEQARLLGTNQELLSSYRLDNLSSAFASLDALIRAAHSQQSLQLSVFWDHEEIGSKTYLGADSSFVDQILERICLSQKMGREDLFRIKNRSLCVSVDVAHGYHPSFPDRFDPLNTPSLGDGVVLKTSAMQKYATTAFTSAPLLALAKIKEWPLQQYASRSDIPGGSTVGCFMAAGLGVPTVDIGIAAWAMHSIRETISTEDQIALCHFLKSVLEEEEIFGSI